MGKALLTDLYQLRMAASFRKRGMHGRATFSLFVRTVPPQRGYLVGCGLDACLEYLEGLAVEDDDLAELASMGFDSASLDALRGLRFSGDVWAVPEGRVVFADEPLLEVTAPIAEAQLAETYLLNQITFATAVASKAARCVVAARGTPVVDFAFRRTDGLDAAMVVARASALVGFAGTSNVSAARRFGLRAVGTMAHSYVEAFPTEREAFRAFGEDFPADPVFLVDTYDTLNGVRTAIDVIRELGLGERAGIRLDSGDLAALSKEAQGLLDAAGLGATRILVSGGLDEFAIDDLVSAGAPIDAFGVGTKMGVSEDAPALDTVYKVVEYDGRPVMKLSTGKVTAPGAKQVFRGPERDVIGLRDEPPPEGASPMLVQVMQGGERTCSSPTLGEARNQFDADLGALPASARQLHEPVPIRPHWSARADALKRDVGETWAGRK